MSIDNVHVYYKGVIGKLASKHTYVWRIQKK